MRKYLIILFSLFNFISLISMAQNSTNKSESPKEIVQHFLADVRSGLHPEKASEYMTDTVLALQVNSEIPVTVKRTPANYTAHIQEFLSMFGKYQFEVTEILSEGDKVYVRWIQRGKHLADIDGYKATGLPLVEYTSAVYRIRDVKIVEYWLQSDRLGFEEQLKQNANKSNSGEGIKK
jgi:predicted ester cyclase